MSHIDALYEAAQKATPRDAGDGLNIDYGYEEIGFGPARTRSHEDVGKPLTDADFDFIAAADPQTVMALIEVYRAARAYTEPQAASAHARLHADLRAAIEKVEALG